MTGQPESKQAMPAAKKWLVSIFLILHLSALVHSVFASRTFFPPPDQASQFTFLRDAELLVNRRGKTSLFDNLLHRYGMLVGVSQQWNTFAPIPPRQSAHFWVTSTEDGVERVVWSNGVDLDGSSGWIYNPNVKLSEIFYINLPALHKDLAGQVAPAKQGKTQTIRLEAESIQTYITPNGELQRSPKRTGSIFSIER